MNKSIMVIFAIILFLGYTIYDFYEDTIDESMKFLEENHGNIATGTKVGERAPLFELSNLEGSVVQLSDYRGKIVLINFWATWCPPCREEMPHLQRIAEEYQDDVVILGVNLTKFEPHIQDVITFTENLGLSFPIVKDEEGSALNEYRVIYYPTTFVLDSTGVIREVFRGAVDYETIKQKIHRMH